MAAKPNKPTQQLITELARHMEIDEATAYDIAACTLAGAFFNLQDVLAESCERLWAADYLAIVKQIPLPADDDGSELRIQVPAPAGSAEPFATAVRHRAH